MYFSGYFYCNITSIITSRVFWIVHFFSWNLVCNFRMTETSTSLPPDSHLCIFQGGIDSYNPISEAIFPHCSLLFFVIWVWNFWFNRVISCHDISALFQWCTNVKSHFKLITCAMKMDDSTSWLNTVNPIYTLETP